MAIIIYHRYHSDKEDMICEDSSITTISLGESRVIKFRPISDQKSELLINLSHGQVFTMSKKSQKFFEHSVPKDYSRQPRISITLRLINPQDFIETQDICDVLLGLGVSQSETSQSKPQTPEIRSSSSILCSPAINPTISVPHSNSDLTLTPHDKSVTLYISSSMFRHLEAKRLSSTTQDCYVFYYPGASASQMLTKFRNDPRMNDLNLSLVKRVMLMTGTNNVDTIVRDSTGEMLNKAVNDISNLISFLRDMLPSALINVINVLPRKSYQRNLAINQINTFLYNLSMQNSFNINFVNTEAERNLFSTKQGYRKSYYFMPDSHRLYDNVHLNHTGIIRLAKHLKYIAHNT